MKTRKIIASAIAICSVFAFTGFAFAANHVTLKTTVPNIPKSSCDQAGTITMEIDNATKMLGGDVIQYTLNSNVTVCKAIDFFVALADDGSEWISNDTTLPVSSPSGELVTTGTGVVTGVGYVAPHNGILVPAAALTIDGSAAVMGFRVKGSIGSSLISLTLGYIHNADNIFKTQSTAGNLLLSVNKVANDDRLSIKLFDGKYAANYLREKAAAPAADGTYGDFTINESDNALCINTLTYTGSTELVVATPDSIISNVAYKLGFSGDYTVAHVSTLDTYAIQNVCKDACPTVLMAEAADQFGVTTKPGTAFDASAYLVAPAGTLDRWGSTGTCDNNLGNGIILRRSGLNFTPNQKFTVKLELLIDGVAANMEAVKWNAVASPAYYVSSSNDGRCSAAGTTMTAGTAATWALPAGTTNAAVVEATLTAGPSHDSFILDLPGVIFDYKKVVAGAKVEVKVSFGKYPCGGSESQTFCLASFVSKCDTAGAYTLLYPFATGSANATFWSGVVVTNTDSATATATIAVFDTVGGSGSLAISINGKSQFTKTIGQIVEDAAFKSGAKALDPSKDVQISVSADKAVDGLIFVGADGVMHGYLPRVFKGLTAQH